MNKASVIQTRLRGYFEKHSRPLTVAAILQHFTDVKAVTVNYHLQALTRAGFIVKRKRGVYQKSPAFVSVEEKRAIVSQHIATNASRIQKGAPWKPGDEALTETVNPVMFSFIARSFGESVVERMRSAGFTKADVRFIESLLSTVYPLSGPQRSQCERAWEDPTGKANA